MVGKPVAELHPYQGARASSPFGLHPGVRILGDIVSPVADEDWDKGLSRDEGAMLTARVNGVETYAATNDLSLALSS